MPHNLKREGSNPIGEIEKQGWGMFLASGPGLILSPNRI
jgi:hypothetical protein